MIERVDDVFDALSAVVVTAVRNEQVLADVVEAT